MDAGDGGNIMIQMRRGVLPYCVLALLRERECYGVQIVRSLAAADGMVTSEGTVYPLLARLRRQGLVTTRWDESPAGPPRRYYRLTAGGRAALDAFATDWRRTRDAVERFLSEKDGVPPC